MIERNEMFRMFDAEAQRKTVERVLEAAAVHPLALLRLLSAYATWNGVFGAGVAALAAKIACARGIFRDPDQGISALADRSVFVASFFFDAARDEFDDRETVHRDTHRCLSQAFVAGLVRLGIIEEPRLANVRFVNAWLGEPPWLHALCARVQEGYGVRAPDDAEAIFRAMGYHLGSEVLADAEFSVLDEVLRKSRPELVAALETIEIEVAGQRHRPYHWVRVHSGHGGGAEADHFDWALMGLARAERYVALANVSALQAAVTTGFRAFASDHDHFFASAEAEISAFDRQLAALGEFV